MHPTEADIAYMQVPLPQYMLKRPGIMNLLGEQYTRRLRDPVRNQLRKSQLAAGS